MNKDHPTMLIWKMETPTDVDQLCEALNEVLKHGDMPYTLQLNMKVLEDDKDA